MREICHRCGGELSMGDSVAHDGRPPFCPHCGAPQLLLSDYTEPLSTGMEDVAGGPSSGTLPPPRPNQIDWQMAVRIAAIVAAVAATLSLIAVRLPKISPVSTVWIMGASLTTLAIYQRRRPLAAVNAGVGAKIGVLVGIALVFSLAAALAVGMVVARYDLHAMAGFDAETAQAMKVQLDQLAASRPVPPESVAMFNSTEFRAAMMLTGFGIAFAGVFLVSIFGGAVGGLLRTRRFLPKV